MRRSVLLLLARLLLALPTVAQAPEKAVLNDLVVTAEIVGHSYKPAERHAIKPKLILYVRLNIRNQTNHSRDITIMSCGWDDSWIQKGTYGFCGWGCDKNIPKTLTLPPNQSLVFYGPLCRWHESAGKMPGFALGFLDSAGCYYGIDSLKMRDKLLKNSVVYWSNELNGNIDPTITPEIKGSQQYPRYSLSESGK